MVVLVLLLIINMVCDYIALIEVISNLDLDNLKNIDANNKLTYTKNSEKHFITVLFQN